MNYRHAYHAGNFADVFKHIVLVLLLDYLRRKDKPFFVLDTHAGIGLYDLQSIEAQKTGEAAAAIGQVWERTDAPAEIQPYLDIVRHANRRNQGHLRFYPGSPLIIRERLREDDRLAASELHPEDYETLKSAIGYDKRIRADNADGYISLRALLPPAERRGLVLIDPPFEVRNEFDLLVRAVNDGHKRWATGIYVLWYPVKNADQVAAFHQALAQTGIPRIMAAHFMLQPPDDPDKLNGCGMVIINPPWTLAAQLATIGPWLSGALGYTGTDTGKAWVDVIEIAGEE